MISDSQNTARKVIQELFIIMYHAQQCTGSHLRDNPFLTYVSLFSLGSLIALLNTKDPSTFIQSSIPSDMMIIVADKIFKFLIHSNRKFSDIIETRY